MPTAAMKTETVSFGTTTGTTPPILSVNIIGSEAVFQDNIVALWNAIGPAAKGTTLQALIDSATSQLALIKEALSAPEPEPDPTPDPGV